VGVSAGRGSSPELLRLGELSLEMVDLLEQKFVLRQHLGGVPLVPLLHLRRPEEKSSPNVHR
jgi:hypothetical protein